MTSKTASTDNDRPAITVHYDPALAERHGTLREYLAVRTLLSAKPAKAIAADMDMAPSTLSRKLNPAEGDTQRLNVDDLEAWCASTGDAAAVVEYLAARFLDGPERRRERALAKVESLAVDLQAMLTTLSALKGQM